MADYNLHCFAQSGNAYKVALALELAGANWEPVWVDFFKGGHRTDEYRAKNIMAGQAVTAWPGNELTSAIAPAVVRPKTAKRAT